MKPGEIIDTVHLFPVLDAHLLDLLRTLAPEDWHQTTYAAQWCVKDVAAHLLDGNIRALSMLRDGYSGRSAPEINSYPELVDYLNQLNAEWIVAMKRLSPVVLIELLEQTGKQYSTYLGTLDPYEKATFSVAWAGEEESWNWFHVAREYTEKWHHQQQIRAAVGQEQVLYEPTLFQPYLETSMRALPHHYRSVDAAEGTVVKFVMTGENEYVWYLQFDGVLWKIRKECEVEPASEIQIGQEVVWRIFSKGLSPEQAYPLVEVAGEAQLGLKILDMVAVMA